jgi:hypothetical protein
MDPGENCCSQSAAPMPDQPIAPPGARSQQQAFQAILLAQPLLLVLPLAEPADFPQSPARLLSSAGPSAQALLCVRTV